MQKKQRENKGGKNRLKTKGKRAKQNIHSCLFIEKLVLCVYGVIMHLGNVRRILEKRLKHSATPRVLHASLVFS